ncbi:MAG: hypothetical protein GX772_10400 [Alcaligenaceae bacterium]|nr:hypothetical protein [Alcaligenaceae bacterium]
MYKKIPAMKALLEIRPEDEFEIQQSQPYLQQHHERFHASTLAWADTHNFATPHARQHLLITEFFCTLVSGKYEDRFHAVLYRQSLKWYLLKLDINDVLLLLGRICQTLQEYAAPLGRPHVQRTLGLVVEIARVVAVKIHQLGSKLHAV